MSITTISIWSFQRKSKLRNGAKLNLKLLQYVNCKYLVYYEYYDDINMAITREKQIKKWGEVKKNKLNEKLNPGWN